MKKILILSVSILLFSSLQTFGACKIEDMNACKANLETQNQTIQDKLVPNHLNQIVSPTRDTSKEFTNTPHTIPEMINMDVDENPSNINKGNTPYNANCQFGNCLPGRNTGSGNIGE